MNMQKQFTEDEKFQINAVVQIHLTDLEITKSEITKRLEGYLKIISTFLLVIFVIFGYAVNEKINFLFLLIPAFILSGMSLILNKLKSIYFLGVYYNGIEKKINEIFDIDLINWEETIYKINGNKFIYIVNMYLHFMILLPIILLYFASLSNIYLLYKNECFFIPVIVFYCITLLVTSYIYIIFGKRIFYSKINQIVENR